MKLMQSTGIFDTTRFEELSEKEQQEFLKNHEKTEWIGREIVLGDIIDHNTMKVIK